MRVRQVTIENFKRFEKLTISFGDLDCLVGTNNSGKTTLLQALALFDFCVHHCLARKNGHLEIRNRTIAPEDFYVLPVSDPMDIWHERRAMEGGKQRRVRIIVGFDDGDVVTATVQLNFNRLGVSLECSDDTPEKLAELAGMRIAYLPVFSSFLPREERRLTAVIEDETARGRVHGIIRNLLLGLSDQRRIGDLEAILKRGFPGLTGLKIEFDDVTDRYIAVTYREAGHPKEFDIFSAGSGFQQFLYLFGFILLREPNVILLDEPDVHLHGVLQHTLLSELRSLVRQGKQILFATHSRDLINHLAPEEILSLDEGEARRLTVQYDKYDMLQQLGSLDPTQLTTVQAYRRVVVVEDAFDRDLLSIFFRKTLGDAAWQQVERRIAFCYSKGNPWKQHDLTRLREILQQMLAMDGGSLELFVIADRDYLVDVEDCERRLFHGHIHGHIWRRTEIENYLLSTTALRRLLPHQPGEPSLFDQPLLAEFDAALEASRGTAHDRITGAVTEFSRLTKNGWDPVKISQLAREHFEAHWPQDRLALADAKSVVLPRLKRWFQDQRLGQFSDRRLAQELEPAELPDEVHELGRRLAMFAGVKLESHVS